MKNSPKKNDKQAKLAEELRKNLLRRKAKNSGSSETASDKAGGKN